MPIKAIEPIPIRLPMIKPVIMAGEEVRHADNVLVRIEADNGVVGWGEAASAPTMTGETIESIVAAVHRLGPILLGRNAQDIGGALIAMEGRLYGNHGAKAAVEIALHDLVGRTERRPVHSLLGAKQRNRLAVLRVIGSGDCEGDLQDAITRKREGFTLFKIKVGVDTPQADAARTREICNALGTDCVISADANQGFSTAQALGFVRALAGAGLAFVEQPVRAADLEGMTTIAAATEIAIGADEGIHSLEDIRRHHAEKAARGVSLKAIKLGGLRAVLEAGRLCERLAMSVNVSCKTGESSIACAAALHAAATIPKLEWGLTLTNGGLRADVTPHPVAVESGHTELLDEPGLGVEVDEDRIRMHRLDIARL